MITRLSAIALKGQTFSEELSAVTIWTGANGRGKTSHQDAATLAMLGYHPSYGKTGASIMQLCSGDRLEVGMTIDPGNLPNCFVQRCWTRDAKGGVKATDTEPLPQFPSVLLNPREYFDLSPAKRIELVAGMVQLNDPQFQVAGIIAAVKNIRLDENTTASETAVDAICNSLNGLPAAAPLPWLETALQQVRDDLKARKQTRARMVGVTTGLEQLRAQDQAAAAGSGTVERDLRDARAKLAALQKDSGTLEARIQAAAGSRRRQEQLRAVKAPEGVDEAAIGRKRGELELAIAELMTKVNARTQTTQQLRNSYHAFDKEIAAIEQRIGQLEAAIQNERKALEAFLQTPCCPTCRRKTTKDWQAEYRATTEGAIAVNEKSLTDFVAQLATVKGQRDTVAAAAQAQAIEDMKLDGFKEERESLDAILRNAATALDRYRAAQQELATASQPEANESLAHEQAQLQEKLASVRSSITELEGRQRNLIAEKGRIRDQMLAAQQATATEAEIAVLTAAGKLLTKRQADLVARAFKGILDIANQFAACILPEPLLYRDGDLGCERNGTWVSQATFSGAEQAVVQIGIAAALAQGAQERIVLFDEMSRVSAGNKRKIVEQMLRWTAAGTVTQFLGNDLEADAYRDLGPGVKVIPV